MFTNMLIIYNIIKVKRRFVMKYGFTLLLFFLLPYNTYPNKVTNWDEKVLDQKLFGQIK